MFKRIPPLYSKYKQKKDSEFDDKFFAQDPVLKQFYGKTKRNNKKYQDVTRASFPTQKCHVDLFDLFGNKDRRVTVTQKALQTNEHVRYGLVCIDCYSRYAWVVGLTDKSAQTTLQGFKKILKAMKPYKILKQWQPTLFMADKGLEFTNKTLKGYLEPLGHKLVTLKSEAGKSYLAERFIRTYRTLLSVLIYKLKYLKNRSSSSSQSSNSNVRTKWSTLNSIVVNMYNTTVHKAFHNKFTPQDMLTLKPEALDYSNAKTAAFDSFQDYEMTLEEKEERTPPPLHIDDYVYKLTGKAKTFTKASENPPIDTTVVYQIAKIRPPSLNLNKMPLYYLKTLQGHVLKGVYRQDSLVKVAPPSPAQTTNKKQKKK